MVYSTLTNLAEHVAYTLAYHSVAVYVCAT